MTIQIFQISLTSFSMQILDHDNQGRMISRVECHGRKDHKSQGPRGGADFRRSGFSSGRGGGGGGLMRTR